MKQSTVNRTVGGHFEAELCDLLAEHGWWAHNMAQNQVGQPADVIAVKDNTAVLIDCKVCANNRFPLSRVECNQEGAMTLWEQRGNAYCYFAMKLADGSIYMVSFDELCLRELHGLGTITEKDFPNYLTFDQWLRYMEVDNGS
jgi:Holliday junction resolvase